MKAKGVKLGRPKGSKNKKGRKVGTFKHMKEDRLGSRSKGDDFFVD